MKCKKSANISIFILCGIFLLTFLLSISIGRYPIQITTLCKVLLSKIFPIQPDWEGQINNVIFQVRLPRVVMAMIIGAGLSCSGAVYQGIFQNPMVSPDVLGASAGASFGAAFGLILGMPYQVVTLCAFCFGLISVSCVVIISNHVKNNKTLGLVLSGIMIGSLFQAAVSFIKLVADPNNTLPVITYWLMGSLASIRIKDVCFAAPIIIAGLIPFFLLRWKINILTLGEEEAKSVGVNTKRVRSVMILSATLITAAAVSVSGLIGWVGLVIPHLCRMMIGNDYRKLIPATMLLGGSYLMWVDNLARMITTSEVPIGILTAFIGAPFFLYLISKEGNHL